MPTVPLATSQFASAALQLGPLALVALALRAPRAHAGAERAPRARLAPGVLLRRLRRDRSRAHLARLRQPGPAVRAHDRAPAARRHRRAADRARPHRAAARARAAHPAVRPPAGAHAPGRGVSAVGDRPLRVARCRSSTKPRCATRACTRSSTRCSSASASTCGCACSARCRRRAGSATSPGSSTSSRVRLAGTVLGNIFLWSGTVFYPFYRHGEALHHISPLADQSIAGAIMMVEESILTLCLFCWLFLRTAREGEERQELLDYARLHGARADRGARRARGRGRRGRASSQASGGRRRRGRATERTRRPAPPAQRAILEACASVARCAAASAASGFRTWLQNHHFGWLTPRRLRRLTIAAMCAAGLFSSLTISGSTPPARTRTPRHTRASARTELRASLLGRGPAATAAPDRGLQPWR